jgi:hypothetical protein
MTRSLLARLAHAAHAPMLKKEHRWKPCRQLDL